MKRIRISSEKYGIFYACIDASDYKKVIKYKWHIVKKPDSHTIYARTNNSGNQIYMHTLVMGKQKNMVIDHKDFNGLNNQKNNLRLVTFKGNNSHRNTFRKLKHSFKGVMFDPKAKKNPFRTRIVSNYKVIYGGSHSTEISAAIAYNKLAIMYHGEFAVLNKIPS